MSKNDFIVNGQMPAFPSDSVHQFAPTGLTKREYFAAHAPQAPDWFAPKMPAPPEKRYVSLGQGLGNVPTSEYRDWLNKELFERSKQWPSFYADELLKQLEL